MRVYRGLSEVQGHLKGCVVTIGNFDGVHLGHRALFQRVLEKAESLKAPSVVLTFDQHPGRVLRPEQGRGQKLFSLEDMEQQLEKLGITHLIVESFTSEFARIEAKDFVDKYLWAGLRPTAMIVGHDFSFGRDRKGNYDLLEARGRELGFQTERLEPILLRGNVVSSTLIRERIRSGDVEGAQEFLGRFYHVEGDVDSGEGRGRKLGFPTVNLNLRSEILPADGVYVTELEWQGKRYPSVTNVGKKPTVHENFKRTVESHILGTAPEISRGGLIRVFFLKRLRPELKFPSAHELIKQIGVDVESAKKFFGE